MKFLPPWPDAATLEVMPWWAVGGAAAGLALVAFRWLTRPGVFGEVVREAPIHVPGAPQPHDPVPVPWGPAGLRAALFGAIAATLCSWGWYGPEESQYRFGLFIAAVGVAQSLWHLLRVQRDGPVVGEAPPEDPENTLQARLPGAWGGLVMAALGVMMAYL